MADEATLVLIKPDAIQRRLTGLVIARLDELGLEIIGAKVVRVSRDLAETHYAHLREKPFFSMLLDHLQGKLHGVSSLLAFVYWGPEAIRRVREATGATHPERADPRSIRGSFGRMTADGVMENIVHASATDEEAQREIPLWFRPQELVRAIAPRAANARVHRA